MSIAGDRYWTRRALASIRSEQLTYVKFAFQKAVTYWLGDPGADWGNRNVFSYTGLRTAGYSPADAVKLMIARAAPIVAIAAVVLLWPQRHLLFPVYLLLVFTTVFHAATHAEARLNEPFQPFLMVLIAGAADLIHRAGARGS